jgi:AraC family transcriptional regulator
LSDGAATGGLPGFKLRRAKEFINEHLEEDLTLQQVAKAVGFSQFHFARAFRRSTGLTPQQYLVQQRINRAKELLIKGDLPLVEVSFQAGFKNQSHFTTVFRKFTAFTPKAFREAKHQ